MPRLPRAILGPLVGQVRSPRALQAPGASAAVGSLDLLASRPEAPIPLGVAPEPVGVRGVARGAVCPVPAVVRRLRIATGEVVVDAVATLAFARVP